MKHFFFEISTEERQQQDGLLDVLLKTDYQNDRSILYSVLYDAADILHDKRLEATDEELKRFFDESVNNVGVKQAIWESEAGHKYRVESKENKGLLDALKVLWNFAESAWDDVQVFKNNPEENAKVEEKALIYFLCCGNIALRISQYYYYAECNLPKSDYWGDRTMEIIWHGKNFIKKNSDRSSKDNHDSIEYALDLLLAKYHRDYARRNRRSNYDNANNEYRRILEQIKLDLQKPFSNEQKRPYLMIYMEALYNIISIQRREYHLDNAINCCGAFILDCTSKIELITKFEIGGLSDINKLALNEINEYVKKVNNVCLNELDLAQVDKADKTDFDIFMEIDIINYVTSKQGIYDVIRYFLLVTLDLSRILRDMHNASYCKKAIKLANYANQISIKMDRLLSNEQNENIENNIDALMLESNALRKCIKYANNMELKDLKSEQPGNYTFREDGYSVDVVNSLNKIKILANKNHFSSKIEIAKWYCLGLKHKALRRVVNFPTKAEVFKYLDENDTNIEVIIRKGKVLLDLRQFEDAIQLFEQMLEDFKDETFYIRLGSRGLKIRYMLANAYISIGNITKAKTILQDLYDKIKEVNENKKKLTENREPGVDFRVIMDLIYCNMRQGNYDNAYKLYDLHQKDFYGNKKLENTQELTGNGFMIGEHYLENEAKTAKLKILNNLIGCCILSIDDSVFKEVNESKEEMETAERKKGECINKLCVALRAFVHLKSKFNIFPDNDYENDPETNLYKGFFTLLTEPHLSELPPDEHDVLNDFIEEIVKLPSDEREKRIISHAKKIVERIANDRKRGNQGEDKTEQKQKNSSETNLLLAMTHAQKYFSIACNCSGGFSFRYKKEVNDYIEDIRGLRVDRAGIHHQISYFSAYLINLVRIYQEASKLKDEKKEKDASNELREILIAFPKNYKISLKAAIALAEWILEEENKKNKLLEALDDNEKKQKKVEVNTEMDEYYRPFGFVTIYEEEGAVPFNQLRDNHSFRLLESTSRARVMVRLLAMYNPIKAIKEECSFHLGYEQENNNYHLVHYTSLDTLKALMKGDTTQIPSIEKELNRLLIQLKNELSDTIIPPYNIEDISPEVQKSIQKYCKELLNNIERTKNCAEKYKQMIQKKHNEDSEPHFRLSSCGYMNDVFEGRKFLECMQIVEETKEKNYQQSEFRNFVRRYFPHLERSARDMRPSSSDIYIASLSVKEDSFPLWSIYAKDEEGCNIEFGKGFFDIHGSICNPSALRPYLISNYTDQDYPLYIVQYIDERFKKNYEKNAKAEYVNDSENIPSHKQVGKTRAIDYKRLGDLLDKVYHGWKNLDDYLAKIDPLNNYKTNSAEHESIQNKKETGKMRSLETVRRFTADRLNEVRFLFKDSDYEFEGEIRTVYTDSSDISCAKMDYNRAVPVVYVDVNRKITDLTVRLGSKINDITVDQIVTWLKHTNRVNNVMLAERNRFTSRYLSMPDTKQ